jgi:hypothetical protein
MLPPPQSLEVFYDLPNRRFRAEFLHTQRSVIRRYDLVRARLLKPGLPIRRAL